MIKKKIIGSGTIALVICGCCVRRMMSNVLAEKPSNRIPASMKAEPATVNSTNLSAAYSLRPVPQIEMRKYIGTSSTSQNRKKSRKSREVNTPRTPVSRISIQAKYSFVRRSMLHEMSTDSNVRPVVSSTSGTLSPSTPTWYCNLNPDPAFVASTQV